MNEDLTLEILLKAERRLNDAKEYAAARAVESVRNAYIDCGINSARRELNRQHDLGRIAEVSI